MFVPGCLVGFNDYPAGDWGAGGKLASTNGGGPASAGGVAGSTEPPVTIAGSGAASGSAMTAGTTSGGVVGSELGGGAAGEPSADAGAGGASEPNPNLIDDFEDGDEHILRQQGRDGSWFVRNDGTATQAPAADAPALPSSFVLVRSGSERGMHTTGGPFETWGAVVGTTLATSSGIAVPYDLSHFQGLKLWLRTNSTSPNAAKEARLNFVAVATSSGSGCTVCDDHWGAPVPLTSKWVEVDVPFSGLRQAGFGVPRLTSPDLTGVTALELAFPAGVSFDLWLDDPELY